MLEPRCGESPQVRYLRGGRRSNASPLPDRWGVKREQTWLGYKLHVTETCDDRPACSCPPDPAAAASGRCGHDVRPNLITGVATTDATVTDTEMTAPVTAALDRRTWPRAGTTSIRDTSARHVLDAARLFGITLVSPLLADTSRQARSGAGYDRAAFAIDYDTRTVTCPQGRPAAAGLPPGRPAGTRSWSGPASPPAVPARPASCAPPRPHGRQLTILPRDQHELQAAARAGQQREAGRTTTRRAGVEGTSARLSPSPMPPGPLPRPRQNPARTRLLSLALNLCRLDAYWNGTPWTAEEPATWPGSASPHHQRN